MDTKTALDALSGHNLCLFWLLPQVYACSTVSSFLAFLIILWTILIYNWTQSEDDGTVRLWDTRSGSKCVKALSAFDKNPVQLVTWAPPKCPISNSLWAACGRDLYCFDIRGNDSVLIREPLLKMCDVCEDGDNDDELSFINLHPKNGEQVAVADDAGLVHLLQLRRDSNSSYFLERGPCLASHQNIVTGVLFRPSTLRDVVSGSLDGSIAGWDTSKPHKPLWTESIATFESTNSAQSLNPPLVHAIAVHGTGRYFAAGLGDGSVYVNTFSKTQRCSRRLTGGHTSGVAQVHFAGFDDELLISAGNDKRVSFWRLGSIFQKEKAKSKSKTKTKSSSADSSSEIDEELAPHARLAHTEKINWLASSTATCSVYVADVSSVITILDVSRL